MTSRRFYQFVVMPLFHSFTQVFRGAEPVRTCCVELSQFLGLRVKGLKQGVGEERSRFICSGLGFRPEFRAQCRAERCMRVTSARSATTETHQPPAARSTATLRKTAEADRPDGPPGKLSAWQLGTEPPHTATLAHVAPAMHQLTRLKFPPEAFQPTLHLCPILHQPAYG